MPFNKKFSKRRNSKKKLRSRRTKRVGNCNMVHDMLYKPPCQGVVVRGGGELDPGVAVPINHVPSGCESYQIDVTQGYVGGQPIVSGNPVGCLDTQMHNFSRTQGGGGAACPSGYTLDLSQGHIGGRPVYIPINDHCGDSISHFAGGARRGKGSGRGRGKGRGRGRGMKKNRSKGSSNRNLKSAIEKFCTRRRKSCSKKFKKNLYNQVKRKLCN